jgi:hypothetical protein
MKSLDIQVSKAPKYLVSNDIQSLLLINYSYDSNFTNWSNDSLTKLMVERDLNLDTIFFDSIAADTSLHTAAMALFESGRFDVVVPFKHNYCAETLNGKGSKLEWNVIDSLCRIFETDALVVQESFGQFIKTDFDSEFTLDMGKLYTGAIDLVYSVYWGIYKPSDRLYKSLHVIDTIFWDSYSNNAQKMLNDLPELKDALVEGGVVAGIDFAKQISPKWINSKRKYYATGDKDIDSAAEKALEGNWEEAADIWMKHVNVKSKKLRSKIEFNLALAFEMTGDIEKAIEWGVKSYKTYYRSYTNIYLKELDQIRKKGTY